MPGRISAVGVDGTYSVAYSDGDTERRVPGKMIRQVCWQLHLFSIFFSCILVLSLTSMWFRYPNSSTRPQPGGGRRLSDVDRSVERDFERGERVEAKFR